MTHHYISFVHLLIPNKFMSNCALNHIRECINAGEFIYATDIQWVITVPAIWTDAAKQIMRNAALKAGLPPSTYFYLYHLIFYINTMQV